jgi:hypothetical protein
MSTFDDLCYDACIEICSYLTVNEILGAFHDHHYCWHLLAALGQRMMLHLDATENIAWLLGILPRMQSDIFSSLSTTSANAHLLLGYFHKLRRLTLLDAHLKQPLPDIRSLLFLDRVSIRMSPVSDTDRNLDRVLMHHWLPESVTALDIDVAHRLSNRSDASVNSSLAHVRELIVGDCYWSVFLKLLPLFPRLRLVRIDAVHTDRAYPFNLGFCRISSDFRLVDLQRLVFSWEDVDIDGVLRLLELMPNLVQYQLRGTFNGALPRKVISFETWFRLTQHCRGEQLIVCSIELLMAAGMNPAVSLFAEDARNYLQDINMKWNTDVISLRHQRRIRCAWFREVSLIPESHPPLSSS